MGFATDVYSLTSQLNDVKTERVNSFLSFCFARSVTTYVRAMRENIKGFWILFGLLNTVHGYRHFQTLIPNGDKVPHPCGGGTWAAVGHIQPYHTRTKNAFGRVSSEL